MDIKKLNFQRLQFSAGSPLLYNPDNFSLTWAKNNVEVGVS